MYPTLFMMNEMARDNSFETQLERHYYFVTDVSCLIGFKDLKAFVIQGFLLNQFARFYNLGLNFSKIL